jgi:hypothetical protein
MKTILPQYQKARPSLDSDRCQPASQPYLVSRCLFSELRNHGKLPACSRSTHDERQVPKRFVRVGDGKKGDIVDAVGGFLGGGCGRLFGFLFGMLGFLQGSVLGCVALRRVVRTVSCGTWLSVPCWVKYYIWYSLFRFSGSLDGFLLFFRSFSSLTRHPSD